MGVQCGGKITLTSCEGILEDLLKAEELENGQVHGRVQTETALVGAQGRVELHTVSTVYLDLALVVLPHDAELDDALGDGDNLECGAVLWVLLEEGRGLEGRSELIVSLLEFGLGRKVGHFGSGLGGGGLGREVCGLGITQNMS